MGGAKKHFGRPKPAPKSEPPPGLDARAAAAFLQRRGHRVTEADLHRHARDADGEGPPFEWGPDGAGRYSPPALLKWAKAAG